MIYNTRREFLTATSLVVAGTGLGVRTIGAQPLPNNIERSSLAPQVFLPAPMASIDLQTLATHAVDAARSVGASYADIRVAEVHRFDIGVNMLNPINPDTVLRSDFKFGIRVLVDGVWSFVHGRVPSIDAVAVAARGAVATARGYARLATQRVELVPAPAAKGEWSTPVQLDPFTVPLRDQTALLNAYLLLGNRVRHGGVGAQFRWMRETRVFASSEGALTTQTLYRSDPRVTTMGIWGDGFGGVTLSVPRCTPASGGYETVAIEGLPDDIKRTTEEAVRLAALPRRPFDVGRYPVVFDGATVGAAFARTIGTALEADRVLGYEADAAGTSYLSPPDERLGTAIGSPLLNVRADRALPNISALKWDDDGVETQAFPLVSDGRLVDYYTSRQTAPAFRTWYERQGLPMRSRGCAIAGEASEPVMVRAPHLTVTPNSTSATLDDLCRDMSRGILVRDWSQFSVNQQLASGSVLWAWQMFEVARGKIVRRLESTGLQFNTERFWKSLRVLGDASTMRHGTVLTPKGQPWHYGMGSVTAPAALFKEANVISTAIQL